MDAPNSRETISSHTLTASNWPTCHRVYREVPHDRHITITPPDHVRYFIAKGSPSTPAPTMAVVLWKALFTENTLKRHHAVHLEDLPPCDIRFCMGNCHMHERSCIT